VPDLLVSAPADPAATLLLAHGAGAAMDSPAMAGFAAALVEAGLRVVRFEFSYMAARRSGARKPPPKAEGLVPEFVAALDDTLARFPGPVLIGGKSMGGRIAVMAAGAPLDPRVLAVAVYGYPFHPPSDPEKTRLAPLLAARLPVLIAQGTRDPFGGRDDVGTYALPPSVSVRWFEDGDHDLAPRKASGFTQEDHWRSAAEAFAALARP
jgi:predicted alpha/beta-hydrolase family hydrolase